jgi:hypothetical protein
MLRRLTTTAATLLLAAGLTACGESAVSFGGTARLSVLLTDAPIHYIEAADVDIGAVVLISAGDDPPTVLSEDGTDGPVNLLTLRDAATMLLAEADIEAGTYTQLRLIVESASVTLKDGYAFNDGSTQKDLFVPSGAQTGIKLLLGAADGGEEDGGLDITGDMVLVVDFDVSQSFVIQGNPETPAGIFGMLFKPTVRVVVEDVAGTISGTVSTELEDFDVEDVSVSARPEGDGETATAVTDEDGAYTLQFLAPGSYWVKLDLPDGFASEPDSTLVEVDPSEDVVDVDFEVVDDS